MPPKKNQPVSPMTAQDIADLAGVSIMTVSRCFNAPDKVASKTLERVRRIVGETGYIPNQAASSLRLNRSQLVAAIFPSLSSPVFNDTISTMTSVLNQQGFQLLVGQSGYDSLQEERLLTAILGRRPDGIVLTGIEHTRGTRRMLRASGIPVVEIWDVPNTPIDISVGFSHTQVGSHVARYMLNAGRRHPATIAADDTRSLTRCRAFNNEIATSLGVAAATVTIPAPSTLERARQATRALLTEHPEIDAIFCSSDIVAMGAVIEAQSLGLALPDQLAVIGFGDLNILQGYEPPISSVQVDAAAIGNEAAKRLVQRMRHGAVADPITDLGFSIVSRSTG